MSMVEVELTDKDLCPMTIDRIGATYKTDKIGNVRLVDAGKTVIFPGILKSAQSNRKAGLVEIELETWIKMLARPEMQVWIAADKFYVYTRGAPMCLADVESTPNSSKRGPGRPKKNSN